MYKLTDSLLQQQAKVNTYFQSRSLYWKDIYASGGVQAEVIRDRYAVVLDWIDRIALAPGSRVLEVGCGAGLMAVALAQRGLRVAAIDSSEAMIELACQHALASGTAALLSPSVGDVCALAFEDECFDLVLAIGVIPWLERAEVAMHEMARVTRPGGHVLITTANWAGLASWLDPLANPLLAPLKRGVKNLLERVGRHQASPSMTFHGCRSFDNALQRLGFDKIRGTTRGFAFSLLHRAMLPEPLGTALHHRLQGLADRNVPILHAGGMAYLVLARKSTVPTARAIKARR